MPTIDFAIAIETPDPDIGGLFTGKIALDEHGNLCPQVISRTSHEGEAFAECFRIPNENRAATIANLFNDFGPEGITASLVTIRRETKISPRVENVMITPPVLHQPTDPVMAAFHEPIITPRMHIPIEEV